MNWFKSIAPFIVIITLILYSYKYYKDKREKRIQQFVDKFHARYKHNGCILEALIPAGITTLKNELQIRNAFKKLTNIIQDHPLGNWKDRIESIRYKIFFDLIENSGIELNKHSIKTILDRFENDWK